MKPDPTKDLLIAVALGLGVFWLFLLLSIISQVPNTSLGKARPDSLPSPTNHSKAQ